MSQVNQSTQEQERRWRLILGQRPDQASAPEYWSSDDENMYQCLDVLYNEEKQRGGLGRSSPKIAKWLGDIRQYFPSSVVQIIQKDALERLNLQQMLLEPELLENIEALLMDKQGA